VATHYVKIRGLASDSARILYAQNLHLELIIVQFTTAAAAASQSDIIELLPDADGHLVRWPQDHYIVIM
jgi:hypothetical protein